MKVYRVGINDGVRTVEALGDEVDRLYLSEENAQVALDSMEWDDDWGDEPELFIEGIDVPDFKIQLDAGESFVNGWTVIDGGRINVGGGFIHSQKSARDANNSKGIQPDEFPEMDWPGKVSEGDFVPYPFSEIGDIKKLAKILKIRDIKELVELVQTKSKEYWDENRP